MQRIFISGLTVTFLSACQSPETSLPRNPHVVPEETDQICETYDNQYDTHEPYDLPDHFFSRELHACEIAVPTNFLETLSHHPKNECEREDLRQLFIMADWQMGDMLNQGYYYDAKSEGIGVLIKAFPELLDQEIFGELGVVYSGILKDELLKIRTGCKR